MISFCHDYTWKQVKRAYNLVADLMDLRSTSRVDLLEARFMGGHDDFSNDVNYTHPSLALYLERSSRRRV